MIIRTHKKFELWINYKNIDDRSVLILVPAVGANKSISSEPNNIPPTENNVKSNTPRCCTATAENAI